MDKNKKNLLVGTRVFFNLQNYHLCMKMQEQLNFILSMKTIDGDFPIPKPSVSSLSL